MGLNTLAIPEEKGGPGLNKIDRAALVEEISKYDAGIGITLMANELALDSLEIAGNEEQKDHCYEILANGADIATMNVRFAPNVTKEYNAELCELLGVTVPADYTPIK